MSFQVEAGGRSEILSLSPFLILGEAPLGQSNSARLQKQNAILPGGSHSASFEHTFNYYWVFPIGSPAAMPEGSTAGEIAVTHRTT